MTSEEGLSIKVRKELVTLRARGYWRINDPDLVAIQTSRLEKAARRAPGHRPNMTRVAVIELLLRHEVAKLRIPYRDWLGILFGLRDGDDQIGTDALREQAAKFAGEFDPHVFRRTKEKAALSALADQIVADCLVVANEPTDLPELRDEFSDMAQNSNPAYVPREAIHHEFARLARDGVRLVALVGQAGMGKTTLAEALTESRAPFIRVRDGKLEELDLQAAFLSVGISREVVLTDNPATYLSALLSCPQAPEWVVLDNLKSTAELRHLLPATLYKSRVLVTSRMSDSSFLGRGQVIEVERMTIEESVALLRRKLPEHRARELEELASLLFRHPLIMEYASSLLEGKSVSAWQFGQEFRADVTELAGHAQTEDGQVLSVILHRIAAELAIYNPIAHRLLAGLSFLECDVPLLEVDLIAYTRATSGTNLSLVSCLQAIKHLLDASLLRQHSRGNQTFYVMHPLGQLVLRSEFRPRAVEVLKACVELHYAIVEKVESTCLENNGLYARNATEGERTFLQTCSGWQFLHNVFFRLRTKPNEFTLTAPEKDSVVDYISKMMTSTIVGRYSALHEGGRPIIHPYWFELVYGSTAGAKEFLALIPSLRQAIEKVRALGNERTEIS
ncbi:hypothetical protein VA596_04350 [Amycolatopsis sp., V23-08]|uniref:NB-ARC domain-containing protein n=1 Tax=Amycolatopsis heterodermiae TaxID=3110235 RepID=A0ABU5QXT9_9PSEU|nr:hypothetical protein [Amycolatopsis sp., V23-08]MEA5358756.1 hypothetical protein [Amycolatopsis sp., V23-08]